MRFEMLFKSVLSPARKERLIQPENIVYSTPLNESQSLEDTMHMKHAQDTIGALPPSVVVTFLIHIPSYMRSK